jgi:hypothetical protein
MHFGLKLRLECLVGQLEQVCFSFIEAGRLNQFFDASQSISGRTVRQLTQLSAPSEVVGQS